jgi:hypothetical protein
MFDESTSSTAYLQGTLGLPADMQVESIIAVGYPAETRPPVRPESLQRSKIHADGYGQR